jgi:sulfate-transporting ATPase
VLVAFTICAVATGNMRRGRSGRRLISIRSNERAAASLGIPVVQAKLVAFAISSGIAALGGALLAFREPYITFTGSYDASQSVTLVGFGVVGGVGWLAGTLYGGLLQVGSLASAVLNELGSTVSSYLPLAGGVLLLIVLLASPDGMAAEAMAQVRALARLTRQPERAPSLPDLSAEHGHRVEGRTLQLDKVSVSFGGVKAISEMTLTVRPGEIVGLIGPNGAGKTTLIDAATGFVPVNSGSIRIGETDITGQGPEARTRAGLSRSFQSLELFDDLTVLDNLRAASDRRDVTAFVLDAVRPTTAPLTPATRAAIASFGLEPYLLSKPTDLPYGVRRLVAIARTVATNASIVALDEPAAGLDANESRELGELLRAIATDSGMGVLLVEHNVELVMGLCDRVYALEFGKLIAQGTPAEVRRNPAVIHSYLGDDHSVDAEPQSETETERERPPVKQATGRPVPAEEGDGDNVF